MFDFTSPTIPLNCLFSFYPDYSELGSGNKAGFILEIDGEVILKSLNEAEAGGRFTGGVPSNDIRLVIAPYSRVVFKCSTNDGDGIGFSCAFRGKEIR